MRLLSGHGRFYMIQEGDTLSELAIKFETTVEKLCKLNGIKNPDLIYARTLLRTR